MATIITINSADKLEPDSRNNLNTNFSALNAELITKLPLAGGTMTGDINVDSHKITNLPAPTANGEPARKVDLDNKVGLTGNETIAGVKTFSSIPVVPADSWGRSSIQNSQKRETVRGSLDTNSLKIAGIKLTYNSAGIKMRYAGCIVGASFISTDGALGDSKSQAYRSSGTAAQGRFAIGDKISFFRNTTTGANYPVINGSPVNSAGIDTLIGIDATTDFLIEIELEKD